MVDSLHLEHCNFFFFQAEDGIRDDLVTGVQTCALPIWHGQGTARAHRARHDGVQESAGRSRRRHEEEIGRASCKGKSVDLGGRRIIKKKKKKEKRMRKEGRTKDTKVNKEG